MGNAQEPFTFFGSKTPNAQNNLAWFDEVSKISQETRFTREEVYEYFLKYWKKYSNQKVNRSDMVEIYNSITSAELTLEACDNIFKSIGEDKNGTISFRDLMLACNQIAYGSEEEKLRWAFKVYDTNNDDFISVSELTTIIESFQSKFETSIYKLKTEAEQMAERARRTERAKRTAIEIISKVDDSKDGRISLEEFMLHFYDCQEIAELVRKGIGYEN